jgi:nitrogen-specific signal transduction histidine kinase
VRLQASQLEQVVFNLVLNASDALLNVRDRPRQITVRVRSVMRSSARAFW